MPTSNADILGLDNRVNRFIKEVQDSGSGNVSMYSEADKIRLRSYLAAVIKFIEWVTDQPILDLPESFPRSYDFDPVVEVKVVENEMINDILNLMRSLQIEIRNSQSATASNNFISHDVSRWRNVVTKIGNYIDIYADSVTPLDLPESSPMNSGVTSGHGGTHQG